MLEATDLRIGNKVATVNGETEEIKSILSDGVLTKLGCAWDYNEIYPTPLTEERLKRFGFKHVPNSEDQYLLQLKEGELYATPDQAGLYGAFLVVAGNVLTKPKKHVHQLQNLYHALTGQELPC